MSIQNSKKELFRLIEILPEKEIPEVKSYLESLISAERDKNIKRAQQIMHRYVHPDRLLSEELIAERRKEQCSKTRTGQSK